MSAIISPSNIQSGISVPLEYLLADVERDPELAGYFVTRIEHYKEINTVAHEFLVVTLFNGYRVVRIMIERRPSTKKPAGLAILHGSSYVRVTDDSLSRVNDDFNASKYHHISTITSSFKARFSLRDLCNCCHAINLRAPNYRLASTHCYWFCAVFIALAERGWLLTFERGPDYDRGGTFRNFKVVKMSDIRKAVAGWPPLEKPPPVQGPANVQQTAVLAGLRPDPDADVQWTLERTVLGHENRVQSIALTQDARTERLFVLSGSDDETVRLWDAKTGEQAGWTLVGHHGPIRSVAVSIDGKLCASASDDRTIRIWDLESGQTVRQLEGGIEIRCVAFSPDGRWVAAGLKDTTVRVWDVRTGSAAGSPMHGHTVQVWGVVFSPDGKQLISASRDRTLRLWDMKTFTCTRTLLGHTNGVLSAAFSPDGSKIASASEDKAIFIWDAATGDVLRQLRGHSNGVFSVAFAPDGRHIVSGSEDWTARVWDVESGAQVGGYLHGHRFWVCSAAFSADGQRLVTGSADAAIRVWRPV